VWGKVSAWSKKKRKSENRDQRHFFLPGIKRKKESRRSRIHENKGETQTIIKRRDREGIER
jgi:hypothetical protein